MCKYIHTYIYIYYINNICITSMYLIVYVRYLSEHPQRTKQNPGRHDQRSLGQLRIPNAQDEFGLDNVRFNQAMQNTAGRVDHREKYGEYWRSNCYLGGVIQNRDGNSKTMRNRYGSVFLSCPNREVVGGFPSRGISGYALRMCNFQFML